MKIMKAIGKSVEAIAGTIENTAELANTLTGEKCLKGTVEGSFKLLNSSIEQSIVMSEIEAEEELRAFMALNGRDKKEKKAE